ncbi:hypothetical protein [Shewanella sp. S23-S33]|uniref:hypothetical protein n=1 Tax=Shewanella sp. S23-S33 TaxID=3342769 RepID=UPI00372D3714
MSNAPGWLTKADNNSMGNEVGQAAVIDGKTPRGKPGPKKSLVKRKVVGLNFSEYQNRKLTELEMTLKLAGFELPRGRSEAAELAIAITKAILDGYGPDGGTGWDGGKSWALGFLKSMEGIEDKQAEDDLN